MIESLVQLFETSDLSKQIRWKIFLAGDEETASRRSRESLKAFAKESDLALVFEPGWFDFESETPRIATKVGGNLHLSIVVEGSESHPALAEGLGLNTNDVLASIVLELNSLRTHGISVNVFETSGLSKPNVTTSSSKLRVSIRYPQKTDALLIEKFLRRLEKKRYPEGFKVSFNSRTAWKPQTITINGALKLLSRAAKNSGQKAFKPSLTLARSAAAFLSAQGIPTLDNMSPYGEGFHSADEVLYVGSVFDRLKLLRALVLELLKD
jgi:glutamate carboxypeptidase